MEQPHRLFQPRLFLQAALLLLFGLALAIRLYDLSDLPLDFHPTRQLLSALKARGMYYRSLDSVPAWQREMAVQQWKSRAEVEPEVFEHLVAFTYRFTGERLWVARIYSSLFWLIGGVFLFSLVRDLVSAEGALFAAAYYLFFPYAVIASRSFQPDPLMVMLILSFWWAVNRWANARSWKWALLAGLLGGAAIFIKFVAAFFVIGGALGAALGRMRSSELARNRQAWAMAGLGILPGAAYLFYGIVLEGFLGRQFSGRFIPALLLSPLNYVQWAAQAGLAAGGFAIMLGLLGLFLARDRRLRIFLAGLWGAYLLFGLFFDYHVATHDYYHLPLIPIVAVSLAPAADLFTAFLAAAAPRPWMKWAMSAILLYGLLAPVWSVRNELKSADYRPEAAMWAEIGDLLGHAGKVTGLTQDYGSRLNYWGWQAVSAWPGAGDLSYHRLRGNPREFAELFDSLTAKKDFFLVTDFDQWMLQPELSEMLSSGFAVYARGDGYLVFDLRRPLR